MKHVFLVLGAASVLLLAGCNKPSPAPPVAQPTPTPKPEKPDDKLSLGGKDFDPGKLRDKANQAANSFGKFLDQQDPKMKAKFQRLTDKLTEQFDKDKGRWREKLQSERQQLGPQIDKLKAQLAQGGVTKDKLRDQLSALEQKSATTDQKLSKLESVGVDAWKNFKAQLKEDESRDRTPPTDEAATPTPSPTGE